MKGGHPALPETLPKIKTCICAIKDYCDGVSAVDLKMLADIHSVDWSPMYRTARVLIILGYVENLGGRPRNLKWIGPSEVTDELVEQVYEKILVIERSEHGHRRGGAKKRDLFEILTSYSRQEVIEAYRKYLQTQPRK